MEDAFQNHEETECQAARHRNDKLSRTSTVGRLSCIEAFWKVPAIWSLYQRREHLQGIREQISSKAQ
jgi:hypothetical protein